MSIWKLRLGLNPFTLLALTLTGLVLVVSYFYLLSFFLSDASPDQGPGARRRLLWGRCPSPGLFRLRCCVLHHQAAKRGVLLAPHEQRSLPDVDRARTCTLHALCEVGRPSACG
jgi:hypothetical protein